jgi:hypothetical protein
MHIILEFGNFVITLIQKYNEIKDKKYHTVETVLKSNKKIVERDKIDAPSTQKT